MKKYSISLQALMVLAAFVIIDGTSMSLCSALCALWHELWHIIALKLFGKRVGRLSGGGIGISLSTGMLGYREETLICLAGPLASLFGAGAFFVISRMQPGFSDAVIIACANLALFAVNILPVYPLDGGRALCCILAQRTDEQTALKTVKKVSVIFLLPLSCLSVIIFVESGFNLSLAIICVYLALGVISL